MGTYIHISADTASTRTLGTVVYTALVDVPIACI